MKVKISLVNIPALELTRRVFNNRNVSLKGIILLVVYYLKLLAVIPVACLQHIIYSRRIQKTVIDKPPVFIIGHYRSGTTFLHKLLAADKRFGFVTHYDMICPNSSLLFGNPTKKVFQFIIDKLKIKTPFFNTTIPSLDEPAEEERLLINKGSAYADYWRFVFPLGNVWETDLLDDTTYIQRWRKEYTELLKLISFKNRNKQLVVKSPCNTQRIKHLLKIFPDARFIYISRNPYQVFYSTLNLWEKAIEKFCLQRISAKQKEDIIFCYYTYLIKQYKRDKALIPAGNLVEILYETLEAEPLDTLRKIYKQLRITGFKDACSGFKNQLQKEKKYSKFNYNPSEEVLKKIDRHWQDNIVEWKENYAEYRAAKCTFKI